MMINESILLISIWDRFSDYISVGDKQEAADALVGAFLEEGTDIGDLLDAEGECNFLDRAIAPHKTNEEGLDYDEDGDLY